MIQLLRLNNFKRFEDQTFELRGLNLLSGLNGTGKSSVLQSLLLLRQSYEQGLLQSTGLALNGDLIRLGTARDILCDNAKENKISFELTWNDEKKVVWPFIYDSGADVLMLDQRNVLSAPCFHESLFSDKFHYLQAERLGPRTSFEMSDFQVRQHRQLGSRGEYTSHFLTIFGDEKIPHHKLAHSKASSLTLTNQVEAWMGEISPGTRIHLTPNSGIDLVGLRYSFVLGNDVSSEYRPTNVGFGITYTLPIIVAVLSSSPGTLLLIENPEAHLHPKGQARMGEMLALAASCGVQVLVESHSDHVLNGIRLAVHANKLQPEDVRLYFFQRQEQSEQSTSAVVSPDLDGNGRIDRWPDGFFDEWDKSLDALLEPAGEW